MRLLYFPIWLCPLRAACSYMLVLLGLGRLETKADDYPEADRYFRRVLTRLQSQHPATADNLGVVQNSLANLYNNWQQSGLAPIRCGRCMSAIPGRPWPPSGTCTKRPTLRPASTRWACFTPAGSTTNSAAYYL